MENEVITYSVDLTYIISDAIKIALPAIITGILTYFFTKRTNKLQNKAQVNEKRLIEYYTQIDDLITIYNTRNGAHDFTDLEREKQLEFMDTCTKKAVYASPDLREKIIELNWADKEDDIRVNVIYNEITDLCSRDIIELKKELGLPLGKFETAED